MDKPVRIITAGRRDITAFFEKSGNFTAEKLDHTPFLVYLVNEEDTEIQIQVVIIKSAQDLLIFPDETPVMGQWTGKFRSDFFQFTVGEYRTYLLSRYEEA